MRTTKKKAKKITAAPSRVVVLEEWEYGDERLRVIYHAGIDRIIPQFWDYSFGWTQGPLFKGEWEAMP